MTGPSHQTWCFQSFALHYLPIPIINVYDSSLPGLTAARGRIVWLLSEAILATVLCKQRGTTIINHQNKEKLEL
jgi:hypothetical protein